MFALLLVMLTYNPSGYSYSHWLQTNFSNFGPLLGIAGISLIIGWVVYLRATLRSLGLIDWGWLGLNSVTAMSWVILILISTILAVGISWSHIRRKWSGQIDSDDIDDE